MRPPVRAGFWLYGRNVVGRLVRSTAEIHELHLISEHINTQVGT
jgi:hypothetical protein